MKALSIRQPWAWLIIRGWKDVENRTWKTNYRGPLLIHTSKHWDLKELEMANRIVHPVSLSGNVEHYHLGYIIGIAELYDCVEHHDSIWFEGPYGFLLKNAKQFAIPMKYKGQLGLFDINNKQIHDFYKEQGL
jgi:hypothetical protein